MFPFDLGFSTPTLFSLGLKDSPFRFTGRPFPLFFFSRRLRKRTPPPSLSRKGTRAAAFSFPFFRAEVLSGREGDFLPPFPPRAVPSPPSPFPARWKGNVRGNFLFPRLRKLTAGPPLDLFFFFRDEKRARIFSFPSIVIRDGVRHFLSVAD